MPPRRTPSPVRDEPQLPRFTGSDPSSWIVVAEQYFRFYPIDGDERFSYVIEVFEDKPFYWFNSWFQRDLLTWNDFTTAMLTQFYDHNADDDENSKPLNLSSSMPSIGDSEVELSVSQLQMDLLSIEGDCKDKDHSGMSAINCNFKSLNYGCHTTDLIHGSYSGLHIQIDWLLQTVVFDPGPSCIATSYTNRTNLQADIRSVNNAYNMFDDKPDCNFVQVSPSSTRFTVNVCPTFYTVDSTTATKLGLNSNLRLLTNSLRGCSVARVANAHKPFDEMFIPISFYVDADPEPPDRPTHYILVTQSTALSQQTFDLQKFENEFALGTLSAIHPHITWNTQMWEPGDRTVYTSIKRNHQLVNLNVVLQFQKEDTHLTWKGWRTPYVSSWYVQFSWYFCHQKGLGLTCELYSMAIIFRLPALELNGCAKAFHIMCLFGLDYEILITSMRLKILHIASDALTYSIVCASWIYQYMEYSVVGTRQLVLWIMDNQHEYFYYSTLVLNRTKQVVFLSELQFKQWMSWWEQANIKFKTPPYLFPCSEAYIVGSYCSSYTPLFTTNAMMENDSVIIPIYTDKEPDYNARHHFVELLGLDMESWFKPYIVYFLCVDVFHLFQYCVVRGYVIHDYPLLVVLSHIEGSTLLRIYEQVAHVTNEAVLKVMEDNMGVTYVKANKRKRSLQVTTNYYYLVDNNSVFCDVMGQIINARAVMGAKIDKFHRRLLVFQMGHMCGVSDQESGCEKQAFSTVPFPSSQVNQMKVGNFVKGKYAYSSGFGETLNFKRVEGIPSNIVDLPSFVKEEKNGESVSLNVAEENVLSFLQKMAICLLSIMLISSKKLVYQSGGEWLAKLSLLRKLTIGITSPFQLGIEDTLVGDLKFVTFVALILVKTFDRKPGWQRGPLCTRAIHHSNAIYVTEKFRISDATAAKTHVKFIVQVNFFWNVDDLDNYLYVAAFNYKKGGSVGVVDWVIRKRIFHVLLPSNTPLWDTHKADIRVHGAYCLQRIFFTYCDMGLIITTRKLVAQAHYLRLLDLFSAARQWVTPHMLSLIYKNTHKVLVTLMKKTLQNGSSYQSGPRLVFTSMVYDKTPFDALCGRKPPNITCFCNLHNDIVVCYKGGGSGAGVSMVTLFAVGLGSGIYGRFGTSFCVCISDVDVEWRPPWHVNTVLEDKDVFQRRGIDTDLFLVDGPIGEQASMDVGSVTEQAMEWVNERPKRVSHKRSCMNL